MPAATTPGVEVRADASGVPLPPLATPEDVVAAGGTVGTSTARLLDAASAAVREACGWCLSAQTAVELPASGTGSKVLQLPTLWLTAVHGVTVDGSALETVPRFLVGGLLLTGAPLGARVVATVDHGYDPIPADVSMMVAGLVAQVGAAPLGVTNERIGAWSVSYNRATVRLGPAELAGLGPYLLPKVP